jgi:PhnB protein
MLVGAATRGRSDRRAAAANAQRRWKTPVDQRFAMQLTTYLSFRGQCEEAFKFYAATLGGRIGQIFPYAGTPVASQVPADWQGKVLHGRLTIGDHVLMAADVAPAGYDEPKGFSLSLQMSDSSEAERVFGELAKGGRIVMPLEKTFWAERFSMVVDRFGIPWLINCGGSHEPATLPS